MSRIQQFVSIILCISILGATSVPSFGALHTMDTQKIIRVAFLGMHFEGIENDIQEAITQRTSAVLKADGKVYYKSETEIDNALDDELKQRILLSPIKEDLKEAAEKLYTDYIYVGFLQNQSNNASETILNGYIIRYDVASDIMYTLEIKSFYESYAQELEKLDEQLVQTITPKKKKGFLARHLPGVIIVGATIVAAVFLLKGTKGQSSGNGGGGGVPVAIN